MAKPFCTLALLVLAPLPALAQSQTPVSHWKFDDAAGSGTAVDSSGGVNGSLMNGPAWSTDVAPLLFANPGSLSFDGINDYVDVPAASFNAISDSFTLSIWVNPTQTITLHPESTGGTDGVFGQGYAVFPTQAGVEAGAGLSVGTNGISVCEHGNSYLPPLLVHAVALSGWNHVAVVYTAKQPALFLNGALVRTGLTSTKVVHPSPCMGGSAAPGNYGPFSGILDDYRIYDRALTPAEVASLAAGGSGFDTIDPGTATIAVGAISHGTVTLTWTAPADDAGQPASGPVAQVALHYSTTGVIDTEPKFIGATPFPLPGFVPAAPGTMETVTVTGLTPTTTYHFCLKSTDESANPSGLSNSPSATTTADTDPAAATLTLADRSMDSVSIEWTAPGDDGMAGTAASYDLRMSTLAPISNEAAFQFAISVAGAPSPAPGGTVQSMTVADLSQYATYHFAMKTSDGTMHVSTLSNSLSAQTLPGGSLGVDTNCAGSGTGAGACLPALAALAVLLRRIR